VYDDTGPTTPQVLRESIVSATSSNGRSTMLSDEGDGEIMIFWGGDNPTFDGTSSSSTKNNSETRNNNENNNNNNENENENSNTESTDN
jgi:hypothetical protein